MVEFETGNKLTYKEKYNLAIQAFSEKMDSRDIYMKRLQEWYIKYGYVPAQHQESFDIFKKERFQSWRHQPKVRKRIQKAARKAAKAKGLENMESSKMKDFFKGLL